MSRNTPNAAMWRAYGKALAHAMCPTHEYPQGSGRISKNTALIYFTSETIVQAVQLGLLRRHPSGYEVARPHFFEEAQP